jgi:glycosyltransferase involved in cell wall biosynthesis
MKKPKVFILYPYYWPLYKSGGPVQSIYNIALAFKDQFDFYFVSLTKDIDGQSQHQPLKLECWSRGVNGENIYYTPRISVFLIFRLVREIRPGILFLNGIFHWHTSLIGLLAGRLMGIKIVISPRGMLQEWALRRGKFKKMLFLTAFKSLINDSIEWHATDGREKSDVYRVFGTKQIVHVASNIPRALGNATSIVFPSEQNEIRLVFLSLINPNKNLHLVIDAVNKCREFTLDIYGPIVDLNYWHSCTSTIVDNSRISYKGSVPPWDVPQVLAKYHFFILPTEGENFGHAIFDSLSVGVPVIITHHTHWKEIDVGGAGFYINLPESTSLVSLLGVLTDFDNVAYQKLRKSSFIYAANYLNSKNYKEEYNFLT